ncbi:hypothetical protein OG897_32340 [Streptomyces sp. NBC_00237]|uniref:hypothetical protein n=1 Tax=Streptomyces sp. NBC_00237 TaxID=2975687 RepID=UPI002259DC4D|nr:hypothetical protein [Streptomyces sp. NBC_00237]MCX5206089.1 hypothetical protein [Streptomyces sp. NBC_00237]
MTDDDYEDIADLQAETTDLLTHHAYAPLLDDQYVRGVMPAPDRAPAVRVALGAQNETAPSRLTVYEVPLQDGEDLRTPHDIVALLRGASTAPVRPTDAATAVMGMNLYRVDPTQVKEAPFTTDDWTSTLLQTLTRPAGEDSPSRLRGFLFREAGLLRLYMGTGDNSVIGAEVQPGGALTALLAVLPSMLEEEWRALTGADDPHCRYVVDLTDW